VGGLPCPDGTSAAELAYVGPMRVFATFTDLACFIPKDHRVSTDLRTLNHLESTLQPVLMPWPDWFDVSGKSKYYRSSLQSHLTIRAQTLPYPAQSTNSLGHQCGPISEVQATDRPSLKAPTTSSG
jgi:hypothetical protein